MMNLNNENIKNGIWVKDLELEARGYKSDWEFRDDAYIEDGMIMVVGEYMCLVSDYGTGWKF